jgi:hypothetical protein
MTIQTINIGNLVNDGLGDDLRTAFEKVNSNFSDLSLQLTVTASNVGETGARVFKKKEDNNLEFRNIVSGRNILITEFDSAIEVRNTAAAAFTEFFTDSGSILATDPNEGKITIEGTSAAAAIGPWTGTPGPRTKDIEVTTNGTSLIKIKNIIPVTDILTTFDFGPISGKYTTTIQLMLAAANIDFGTIEFPGSLDLDGGKLNPLSTEYN